MTNRNSLRKTTKRRSTSVPGTVRGFSLQATRFLYYLLKVEQDDIVSLELFEDIGVEKPDGTIIAEQDKSYLSGNPLTNRSLVFWKTLRNWVEAADAGVLAPDRAHFVVYAPNARMGKIATDFHNAKSTTEASRALRTARRLLAGEGDWEISDAARDHVDVVLRHKPTIVSSIIHRLIIDTSDEDPEEALRPLLHEKLVGEDSFELVITWAHGWVKRQIDSFVGSRRSPRIVKKDFHERLLEFVRHHDRIDILRSVAGTPTQEEVSTELAVRDYVKQLRVIELDDLDILEAINDFLGASIDRTVWSDRGMISERSLEALEKELKATWRNKQRRTRLGHGDKNPIDQGQLTYTDCMDHDAKMDNLETPKSFIRGSFHALADDLTIGWHPQYKSALTALESTPKGNVRE